MARMKKVRDPNAPQHCRKCNVLLTRGSNIAPGRYDRYENICRDCERKQRKEREVFNRELDDMVDDMRREHEANLSTPEGAAEEKRRQEELETAMQRELEDSELN